MDQAVSMTLTFRCPAGLAKVLPQPMPAVQGLPDWFKAMPQKAFNPITGEENQTVKRCPPFIDAMTFGFLMPLVVDLKVQDGEFSWDFEVPDAIVTEHSRSPIDFHDPSQVVGTPLFDDDRFIIKFNNFWTIEAPPGYSLLFTHPVNRADLPFTTLTGLVDCDTFNNSPVNFPARWHDPNFNGVLPKGTPVAQCLPIKRDSWAARCDVLSDEASDELLETRSELLRETGVYRRQYRAPKR
jgi:hypothetical protein